MSMPQTLESSASIGVLFSRLDNLIALHQRKLDLLRNIRNSLFKSMLV